MGRLIEVVPVSLGGEIGSPRDWALPYLDDEHTRYASRLLGDADALLLGRRTYGGLSAAYPTTVSNPFVERMNSIPKWVASRTLRELAWNATSILGDLVEFVADCKRRPGGDLLKYGNGALVAADLIGEFHLLLAPVTVGRGQHLFQEVEGAPQLSLVDVTRFNSGVLALGYAPKRAARH
ncbi:MAG TPA: dihydrofolate reductase family protein [Acidimicrobiales bacterium]|nr:dihydrofolate reductase family protein [Acidimicrobiales bacterium]